VRLWTRIVCRRFASPWLTRNVHRAQIVISPDPVKWPMVPDAKSASVFTKTLVTFTLATSQPLVVRMASAKRVSALLGHG